MKHYLDEERLPAAQPLYAQIRDRLLSRILQSEWAAGEALPNEFKLASHYRVSVGTVRRAVEALEEQGLVKRVQGRGTFVGGLRPDAHANRFEHLVAATDGEIATKLEFVSLTREADVSAAVLLGAPPSEPLFAVTQRLSMDGELIGLWRSHLRTARLPRLDQQMRYGQHLYPLLADYGLFVARTEDAITAESAGPVRAELLRIPEASIVLVERRVAYTLGGEAVEVRSGAYVPRRVKLSHATN